MKAFLIPISFLVLFSSAFPKSLRSQCEDCSNIWPENQLAILPSKLYPRHSINEGIKSYSLTEEDCKVVDSIFIAAVLDSVFTFLKKPSIETIGNSFHVQLVPYLDTNNNHIVFINAFCKSHLKSIEEEAHVLRPKNWWKRKLVMVDGGGYCYWNIKLNLDQGTYYDYMENAIW